VGKLMGSNFHIRVRIDGVDPTWDIFVDMVKEQYYPVGNYEDQYIYGKRGAKQFRNSPIPSIPCAPSWVSNTLNDIWF
jgi:hypothetical protein